MLIDWFTVGAQALNFVILVWLMKRFLYKPIVHAIDTREKRIAAELADANTKKAEAKIERDAFHKKNEAFDQERAGLIRKATDEAKAEGERLLDEARKAADALGFEREEMLNREVRNLSHAIERRTQEQVFAIARKALTELAAISLEERMTEVFIRRLQALEGNAKKKLTTGLSQAIKEVSEPVFISSAFDLPDPSREAIRDAVKNIFSLEPKLQFKTKPDLICGIELSAHGQKISWSIEEYLELLEKGVSELLQNQANAPSA